MTSLLLTRSDVERLLDPVALLPDLRSAFAAYSLQRTIPAQRIRSSLPHGATGSAMVLFPGLIPDIPAYTVKVHAKDPRGRPAIRGLLLLHDLETGRLLAAMDSTHLTAVRTGVAGAIAADVLARPDAGRVAIIGAGAQGTTQARSLALVRRLRQVRVYDTEQGQAEVFAARMAPQLAVPVRACLSVGDAVADADIIVAATWARAPFLFADMLAPGVHITTVGPDEPGKCEVDAGVIADGLFVCDDRDLAVTMGAVGGAGLGPEAIDAELGEVIAGARPGRTSAGQTTIYGGVGLAFQDLAAAWHVYRAARAAGVGRGIDFLS